MADGDSLRETILSEGHQVDWNEDSRNFSRLKDIRVRWMLTGLDLAAAAPVEPESVDRPPFEKGICYADQNLQFIGGM